MKPLQWSYSALKQFEQCQRQYHEIKVLKKYPFKQTDAAMYGELMHTALEEYVKHSKPIPPEFSYAKPVVDALLEKPGRKLAEYRMALDKDLRPVEYFDPKVWVRGVGDLVIADDDNLLAWVIDYKSGSNKYPDRDQLILMSIMVFEHFPHIRKVNSALLFLVKNDMVRMSMTREQKDEHWWKYRERVARIAACQAADVWKPTQTPLCGWCAVTGCEFNPKH